MRAPCSGSQLWWTGVNGLDLGGNPASLPASPPSTIHSVPSMVPSQFVFQKAGTARAFVTGTVLCTVNRHRGEPGHTHGTHGRTRAHGSGIIQTNFTTIQTHDPRTHPHDHPNPRTHPHDPQYRVPVRLPPVSFYRYTGNASRGGAARRALECAITLLRMPPWRTATAMHSAMRPRRSRRLLEGVAKHQGARLGIFGIMLTSSSQWVIRPWLYRHIAIFERLAILDGSEVGSPEAAWTAAQCKLYENCVYANEENVLIDGAKTDQTARDAATRVLLGGAKVQVLEGRWIYIAHPDEFIVQDPRTLVSHVERIDPFANVIEFQIIYSVPTLTERLGIREFQATPNGYQRFEPIISLAFCDAKYVWHEARLFRWETGVSWGQRHALTIPQSAPKQGWKFWPKEAHLRRTSRSLAPFIVHFKIHDFSPGAFKTALSKFQGRPWIVFNRSGLHTGIGYHPRIKSRFKVNWNESAEDQIFEFYNRTDHNPTAVQSELRTCCKNTKLEPRCSVEWQPLARFSSANTSSSIMAALS